ncbi:hypothetical protein GMOD_00004208 [Pyrenophora seminiperda CCB06]|uniref:Uncharacterized protein n=1 Tax=Pyrenophora seminiperda CCB06 TaxID=1302712 RepID=A0A3M7M0X6_9PLEO|nr:hypothetical protein GMOD_00004208 [Pyrenophora seminiperda CCB06]
MMYFQNTFPTAPIAFNFARRHLNMITNITDQRNYEPLRVLVPGLRARIRNSLSSPDRRESAPSSRHWTAASPTNPLLLPTSTIPASLLHRGRACLSNLNKFSRRQTFNTDFLFSAVITFDSRPLTAKTPISPWSGDPSIYPQSSILSLGKWRNVM